MLLCWGAYACGGHIFRNMMAACLQRGHQLHMHASRAWMPLLKSICPDLTDMPPACLCLSQGSSFQRISLFSHKNASAIGGTSIPARLPQLYPESFKRGRPNILPTHKRNSENIRYTTLSVLREERD